ncbi:unnamed protein product [Pedinophyceae sp. YPF-701]|nr:unnamed protein product [Pedinophyceae sp. YPF-701]
MDNEVSVNISASPDACLAAWEAREFIPFLPFLDEHYTYEGDTDVTDYLFYYRWAKTPPLQLISTIKRAPLPDGRAGFEFASLEGAPLTGSVEFKPDGAGTVAELKLKWSIPKFLKSFIGTIPIWGDVNDKLTDLLDRFKTHVESK